MDSPNIPTTGPGQPTFLSKLGTHRESSHRQHKIRSKTTKRREGTHRVNTSSVTKLTGYQAPNLQEVYQVAVAPTKARKSRTDAVPEDGATPSHLLTEPDGRFTKRTNTDSTAKKRAASGNVQTPLQNSSKKKRLFEEERHDRFCWVCHKESKHLCVSCQVCPRSYHIKCAGAESFLPDKWVCPECEDTVHNENVDTRSKAMKMVTVDQLCNLLKFALIKMKEKADEAFSKPVSREVFPEYAEYVHNPMDLTSLEKNIKKKMYGCTQSFMADAKWILHNCIVFNGCQHRLTLSAKTLFKVCKQEMGEIEVCPDCYLNAYTKRENWFCEPCRSPHILVWAKLKGFPFWPAKAMHVVNGNVDVRFFGAHDRAWIPVNQCYLLSADGPIPTKNKKKGSFEQSMEELDVHLKKLKEKFRIFRYAAFRTRIDPLNFDTHVSVFFPQLGGSMADKSCATKQAVTSASTDETQPRKEIILTSVEDIKPNSKNEEKCELEVGNSKSSVPETYEDISNDLPSLEVRLPKLDSKISKPRLESCKKLESTIERIKENALDKSDEESEEPIAMQCETDFTKEQHLENMPLSCRLGNNDTCTVSENKSGIESSDTEKVLSQFCEVTSTTRASPDVFPNSGELSANHTVSAANPIVQKLSANHTVSAASPVVQKLSDNSDSRSPKRSELVGTVASETRSATKKNSSEGTAIAREKDADGCLEASKVAHEDAASHDREAPEHFSNSVVPSADESISTKCPEVEKPASISDSLTLLTDNVEKEQITTEMDNVAHLVTEEEPDSDEEDNLVIDLNPSSIGKANGENNSAAEVLSKSTSPSKNVPVQLDTPVGMVKSVHGNLTETELVEDEMNEEEEEQLIVNQTSEIDHRVKTPITVINISSSPPQMVPKVLPVLLPRPSTHTVQTTNMIPEPSSPGPGCDMNKYSRKLMDFMRGTVEEMVRDMGKSGNLEASLKLMQLEMEKLQWRHQQELAEIKHNTDLILLEMRASMESEKQKAIGEVRRQCEIEKQKVMEETKRKQWCSNCGKEAIFYCCWNTSYCDYPCQQAHWPQHMVTCAQSHTGQDGEHHLQLSADTALRSALHNMPQVKALNVNIGNQVAKNMSQAQHVAASAAKSKLELRHIQNTNVDPARHYQDDRDRQGIKLQLPTVSQMTTLNTQYPPTMCPSVQYIPSNAVQVIPQTSSLANSPTALQVQYVTNHSPATNSLTVPIARSPFVSTPTLQGSPSANTNSTGKVIHPQQMARSLQISNSVYPIILQPSATVMGLAANSPTTNSGGRIFPRVPYIPGKPYM